MTKITHPDFIDKLKNTEVLSLLYNYVEAKAGKHIDIVQSVPLDIIQEAETALKKLVNFSKTIE